jgi:glycerol-3-phosphate acyltransferase PlsY
MSWLLTFAYSYLLGSIPFGYILVRTFRNEDVRSTGSGNIGATNVARSSKSLGIATLVLDALKGWLAVLITRNLLVPALHIGKPSPAQELAAFAALAAILGHMFPLWLGFRGGKGVATALGVFIALSWPSALAALGIFLVVFVLTRYVSLASIVAAVALPVFVWILTPNRSFVFMLFTIAIAALVILKHHANIARLRAGTESKFGSSKAEGARA